MKFRYKLLIATTSVAAVLITLAPTSAATGKSMRSERARVVRFWTNARVKKAVSRDFELNTRTHRFDLRGKPVFPGTVTGASWTNGGKVVDTTGKVLFSMGSNYYVCSAGVITDAVSNRSIVLTAGHCVYDETNNRFAENWMFVPAWDTSPASMDTAGLFCESTAYGCWTATSLVASNAFAAEPGFTITASQHDYGFAVMGTGGFSGLQLDDVAGSQPMYTDATVSTDTDTWAFGYPSQGKYKGNDLTYCHGLLGYDGTVGVDWSTYKLGCGMTGGSSGGPWFRDFTDTGTGVGTGTVFSVTSYGYGNSKWLYGPFLNSETAGMFATAATTTANVLYGS
jgi:V8-like Glu-specific endopeptidase